MPHVQIYDHTASQFRGPQGWEPNTTGEGGIVQVYTESMTLKGGKLGGVGEGGSEIPQCPLFCYKTLTILLNWTS